MKAWMKPVCILLAVSVPVLYSLPAYADVSCFNSQLKGEQDAAEHHSSSKWLFGGIVSGMVLGLIGTVIITATSAGSNPSPGAQVLPEENEVEMTCYLNGSESKARTENVVAAVMGGLVGTVLFVGLYITITD